MAVSSNDLDRRKRLREILYSIYDGSSYARIEGKKIIPIENFNHFINTLINIDEEELKREEGIVGCKIFELSVNGSRDVSALENYLEVCEKIRTELFG